MSFLTGVWGFFFSSRRRHTILVSDWSSDVCSSDLPLYMSPEQARGTDPIDARADIFSLGVVLYEALTGGTPHQHVGAMGEIIIRICQVPAPPLQDLAPWVEGDVADPVETALAIDPEGRFPTPDAMLD